MMRSTLLAALVGAAVPMLAFAQTADELKNDDKTPAMYSLTAWATASSASAR